MYLEPEWGFFAELTVEEPECFLIQLFNFLKKIILKKKISVPVILPVYSLFCDISNATDMYFSAKIFTLAL